MIFAVRLRAAPQRWLVAAIGLLSFTALLSAGCLPSPTVVCADGSICGAGQECVQSASDTFCAAPSQIELCNGLADGAECGERDDLTRCLNGFCQPSLCGNDVVDATVGESCEAGVVIVAATCTQRGYDEGEIRCNECTVDTNSCASYCGDGVVDADEECDGEAFNSVLFTTCGENLTSTSELRLGKVICRDCRIDSSACQSQFRTDRIVTLPPIPSSASPLAAFVVHENDVWVVEAGVRAGGTVSYFAHWAGDRWRRGKIAALFEKDSGCDAIWATHNTAFAGCDDGHIIEFQSDAGVDVAVVASNAVDKKITGIWGFAANDVWAAQGPNMYHYDGTDWNLDATWAAFGATANPATGTAIVLGGDVDDLFVLTTTGLFRRNKAGTWSLAVAQPAAPSDYKKMSVVNEAHVLLVATNGSLSDVILYQGATSVTNLNIRNVAAGANIRGDTTGAFYTAESRKALRRFTAARVVQSPTLEFSEVEAIISPLGEVMAVGGSSLWLFGDGLQVAVRGALATPFELQNGGPLLTTSRGTPPLVTQGLDGAVFFTASPSKLFVMNTIATSLEVVDFDNEGDVEMFAPINGPDNAKLMVLAGQKLRVLIGSAVNLSPILLPTPAPPIRGIWSDGERGFVIKGAELCEYQGTNATLWPALATVNPGTVLMTGGRVNSSNIVWVMAEARDGTTRLQRFTIAGLVASADDIAMPVVAGLAVAAVWSSGPDLWIAGTHMENSTIASYFARWVRGRWVEYPVPSLQGNQLRINQMWSDSPGQIWVRTNLNMSFRFDGSRWTSSDVDDSDVSLASPKEYDLAVFGTSTSPQMWTMVTALIIQPSGNRTYHLAHLDNPHPPLTGGSCPAQQELFCRESGHGVSEGPRTIATIVGGRFGAAHFVLNSTLSGRIRFEGQLPAGVEALWALPDPSGTCPPGAPLAFSPNGASSRAEQTLGPSRYFLTLRSRNFADPLDKTEYPVALDYSCNRVD